MQSDRSDGFRWICNKLPEYGKYHLEYCMNATLFQPTQQALTIKLVLVSDIL